MAPGTLNIAPKGRWRVPGWEWPYGIVFLPSGQIYRILVTEMATSRPSRVGSGIVFLPLGPIYRILGTEMSTIRPSRVESGIVFLPLGPIYRILGTEMATIRPSWVGSGKGWWRKMLIRPEYDFGLLHQMARWHSFWALDKFMHIWD